MRPLCALCLCLALQACGEAGRLVISLERPAVKAFDPMSDVRLSRFNLRVIRDAGQSDQETLRTEALTLQLGDVPVDEAFDLRLAGKSATGQMLGLGLGGKTYKLKFGHHGGNHPVKDLKTGKIAITAQNHGFCVDINSFGSEDIEMTHVNLYDNTPEGMRHKKLPIFSVQYHPEASPGPHDSQYLFGEFVRLMDR